MLNLDVASSNCCSGCRHGITLFRLRTVNSKAIMPFESIGEVISEAYILEYGTDCLEMHVGAIQPGERALIIDDLVATGGTLSAAIRLLGKTF